MYPNVVYYFSQWFYYDVFKAFIELSCQAILTWTFVCFEFVDSMYRFVFSYCFVQRMFVLFIKCKFMCFRLSSICWLFSPLVLYRSLWKFSISVIMSSFSSMSVLSSSSRICICFCCPRFFSLLPPWQRRLCFW